MICTTSTVKTSLEHLTQFVDRNLAAGVDHMFVFLDDEMPEGSELLASNPCVTVVQAYGDYWGERRPPGLNTRQTINANLVRVLLAPLPWAQWLFHIDSDEALDIDKGYLTSLAPSVTSIQLQVLEVVSTPDGASQDLFKRPLTDRELTLLTVLGVIDRPENRALYNGYVMGKPGIRPSLDRQLHIHRAKDLNAEPLEMLRHEALRVLHYDSLSLEDFRRKWAAHHAPGQAAVYGEKKDRIRSALGSIVENEKLDEAQKDRYITRLYELEVQDDVATLDELGFLERLSPDRHQHTPRPLSGQQRTDVQTLLPLLTRSHKDHFRLHVHDKEPAALLRSLSAELRDTAPELADALERTAATPQRPPRSRLRSTALAAMPPGVRGALRRLPPAIRERLT